MYTNPNQRIISVAHSRKSDEVFGSISRNAERVAAHVLNDNTASFVLFVHFALHKNGFTFAFSPAALENELGISKDRCRTAFKRLEQAGYLVRDPNKKNLYIFCELPNRYKKMTFDETEPCLQEDIPVETDIPTCEDIPADIDTYTCVQGEGYMCPPVEGISVDEERNTTYITNNNTGNNRVFLEMSTSKTQIYNTRAKFRVLYREWLKKLSDEDESKILNKYLSEHTESSLEKRIGDRYGRFIQGWDDERQRPIVCYSFTYTNKNISHDISQIPQEYYLSLDEIAERKKEEKEAIDELWREIMGDREYRYVDYDEEPF